MTQLEAETLTLRAVVGAYRTDADAARSLLDESRLVAEDFTTKATQAVFVALAAVIRDGRPLDVMTLVNTTRDAASSTFVLPILAGDKADLAKERVATLRDLARRRRLKGSLQGLLGIVDSGTSTESCIGESERVLRQLSTDDGAGAKALDASVFSVIERLDQVQSGKIPPTLQTGIDALDFVIGGVDATMNIIGSLPGVGKSALIATIARNVALRGVRVGVVSLEDEREWITERLMAEIADVPLFVLAKKPLRPDQRQRIDDTAAKLYEILKHIIVEDRPAPTTTEVVASARSMIARGCKAVFVDHLGEVRLDRSDRHDLDIQEALQDLRAIAKTYHVPVVVACHLKRRDGLDKHNIPRLGDFAQSSAIERCARLALGLFAPNPEQLGVVILKQTRGPAGYDFKLDRNKLAGTLLQTQPSPEMRKELSWRD